MCIINNQAKMFNSNFFQSDRSYTREMAEAILVKKGFKNFTFKSSSFSNGASFYFESETGKEIRVSDHGLTGKRAFDTIQVDLVEKKLFKANPVQKSSFVLTKEMIAAAAAKKANF